MNKKSQILSTLTSARIIGISIIQYLTFIGIYLPRKLLEELPATILWRGQSSEWRKYWGGSPGQAWPGIISPAPPPENEQSVTWPFSAHLCRARLINPPEEFRSAMTPAERSDDEGLAALIRGGATPQMGSSRSKGKRRHL